MAGKMAREVHPMDLVKTPLVEKVVLQLPSRPNEDVLGSLVLTTSHLIFQEPSGRRETWLLYHLISVKEALPPSREVFPLRITCKHFLKVTLVFSSEESCRVVMETIDNLAQPSCYDLMTAFYFHPPLPMETRGWSLYCPSVEYGRMGIPNHLWSESKLNLNYELCDTYPKQLYFPATCSDDVITGSSKFRSKGRLPTLTYYYEAKSTSLCRCSQPLSGVNKRSHGDEDLLDHIARATPGNNKVYIIDVRPRVNAWGNKMAGKGFEDEGNYKSADFYFIGIQNIHVMRDSLEKLLTASETDRMGVFWSTLESSGWFGHIKSILDASIFIAGALCREGKSVVVHCSDGWDRTSQTCSLAELMIDPYFRTIHGFMALIEREWLSFGHKFTCRQGFLATEGKEAREFSPVFAQFLECVWQFKCQHPSAFMFNEHFLVTLHQQSYACEYGTFLGNCERERAELKLADRTHSLWDYILSNADLFSDPLYTPNTSDIIFPSSDIRKLRYWSGLYNRFSSLALQRESVGDSVAFLGSQNKALKGHEEYLQRILADLKSNTPPPEEIPLVKMPDKWDCPRFKVQCSCARPFSASQRRFVCLNCGSITCSDCLVVGQKLPWLLPHMSSTICKSCKRSM